MQEWGREEVRIPLMLEAYSTWRLKGNRGVRYLFEATDPNAG